MKLSAYIVKIDSGFAPNPFGGYCTLACCKPAIRRHAKVGDIIVGTAPVDHPRAGGLIYAMSVEKVLTIQEYWDADTFDFRKPKRSAASAFAETTFGTKTLRAPGTSHLTRLTSRRTRNGIHRGTTSSCQPISSTSAGTPSTSLRSSQT